MMHIEIKDKLAKLPKHMTDQLVEVTREAFLAYLSPYDKENFDMFREQICNDYAQTLSMVAGRDEQGNVTARIPSKAIPLAYSLRNMCPIHAYEASITHGNRKKYEELLDKLCNEFYTSST